MSALENLQKQLISRKLDACIITRNNMFLGQDVLDDENLLQKLTSFTGSAGHLIVFRDKAVLLVDGRYDLQAGQQVDQNKIEVVCTRDSVGSWIEKNITHSCRFAYDPWCHSVAEVDFWNRALTAHEFVEDLDRLSGSRISTTAAPEIFELGEQFAGISSEEKISYLSRFCNEQKIDACLICDCDSVSWLLNLRSSLFRNTPVLRAFALVTADGNISLFASDFSKLEQELTRFSGQTIGMAYNKSPKKLQNILKQNRIRIKNLNNPVIDWKAVKNPVEIAGFRAAHLRDAVAVCRFCCWLEQNWQGSDELSVVAKLHEFRQTGQYFYAESFPTIAGFGPNGAVVHYRPAPETNRKLETGSLLLLDSGAQYFDGTTDITRTIAIGEPSAEMLDSCTQVLKAHIAVAAAKFPPLTTGQNLDTLARAALWQFGKDYAHGTGHGVGHFLNVHEGPHSLSLKGSAPLKKDMITSIEPGYYKENAYGVRLENLALIVETTIGVEQPMLCFEPLTMVPFDLRLIKKELLSPAEINWLNNYHQTVLQKLSPLLEEPVARWLQTACRPI